MKNAILIYCALLLSGCNACHKKPLIAKNGTYEAERTNSLFVFVGEKIEVKNVPFEPGTMDAKFEARYKVLQRVYGNYDKDEIAFTAYDHYGWPPFSQYRHVLLFLSKYKDNYFHQKYQFNDVYKTKNGRWAGSYASYDYSHPYNDSTTVKPEIIDFIEEVSYPTKTVQEDGTVYEHHYEQPYFKIKGDKAIAVYGNYIEDLFRLKKEGILTARELFGNKDPEVEIQDVQLEDISLTDHKPTAEELKFIAFWKKIFRPIIRSHNLQKFKARSLDSIFIGRSFGSIDRFNKSCFENIFDKPIIALFKDSTAINYTSYEPGKIKLSGSAKNMVIKTNEGYVVRKVRITRQTPENNYESLNLYFIPTKKGYTLIGIDGRNCGQPCNINPDQKNT